MVISLRLFLSALLLLSKFAYSSTAILPDEAEPFREYNRQWAERIAQMKLQTVMQVGSTCVCNTQANVVTALRSGTGSLLKDGNDETLVTKAQWEAEINIRGEECDDTRRFKPFIDGAFASETRLKQQIWMDSNTDMAEFIDDIATFLDEGRVVALSGSSDIIWKQIKSAPLFKYFGRGHAVRVIGVQRSLKTGEVQWFIVADTAVIGIERLKPKLDEGYLQQFGVKDARSQPDRGIHFINPEQLYWVYKSLYGALYISRKAYEPIELPDSGPTTKEIFTLYQRQFDAVSRQMGQSMNQLNGFFRPGVVAEVAPQLKYRLYKVEKRSCRPTSKKHTFNCKVFLDFYEPMGGRISKILDQLLAKTPSGFEFVEH